MVMGYYIVRFLCPNYEDSDHYGLESNGVIGTPVLWEPEIKAEIGVYDAQKAMWEQIALLRRLRKTLPPPTASQAKVIRALVSIAKENGWKVRGEGVIMRTLDHPVYEIPPAKDDTDEPMPTRWVDIVRWMDMQKWKAEKKAEAAQREKEEQEPKRLRDNKIVIDGEALAALMEDMMPADIPLTKRIERTRPLSRVELQTIVCAELAEENKWTKTAPLGRPEYGVYRIL